MLHAIAVLLATTTTGPTPQRPDCFHNAIVLQQASAHPVATTALPPSVDPGKLRDPVYPVALVQVTIDARGHVVQARIVSSSGNMWDDQSALSAARQSTYLSDTVNCKAQTGSVTLSIPLIPASCNADVSVSNANTPHSAQSVGPGVLTTLVLLNIGTEGQVISSKILRSSGNEILDAAAMATARLSRYKPAMKDCKPIEGTYTFRVDFQPD